MWRPGSSAIDFFNRSLAESWSNYSIERVGRHDSDFVLFDQSGHGWRVCLELFPTELKSLIWHMSKLFMLEGVGGLVDISLLDGIDQFFGSVEDNRYL